MIDAVTTILSLVAFITGFLILLKNKWEFDLRDAYSNTHSYIYIVVCLSTAASFGAFAAYFGGTEAKEEITQVAISINKILGLISIVGFHILSKRILEEKK